jgi:hypothetical protein
MSRLFSTGISAVALTLAVTATAAQEAPRGSAPIPPKPSFESGTGPIVAVDEAHKNTHTISTPSFRGLVQLLRADGYQVQAFAERITRTSLAHIDILLLSGPGGWLGPEDALSDQEVAHLIEWIKAGGSLLLILDHMPAPRNSGNLTVALGITSWHNGYAMVETPDSLIGPIIFWRSDFLPLGATDVGPTGPGGGRGYQGPEALLAKHGITEGRIPQERVQRVASFTGSAFQPPSEAEPLLTMPRGAVSLMPPETAGELPDITSQTPRVPVGGWIQGAVMKRGQGRVALFGETGLFSGGPAADNRQFVLNVLHWLSRLL